MVQVSLVDLEADVGLALNDLQVFDVNAGALSFLAQQHVFELFYRGLDLSRPILPPRVTTVSALGVADHYFLRQLILVVLPRTRFTDIALVLKRFDLPHHLALADPRFPRDSLD